MTTLYLVDDATYQGALTPADYQRAGFDIVNYKLSHGLGTTAVRPDLPARIADTRARGMGVGTFSWLIGNHTGAEQAEYAHARMVALGIDQFAAHTVDVEEQTDADDELPPTWREVADYVTTMQNLLGRPVMLYTGDWYWPKEWTVGAGLTPYLMSAPDAGYPGKYPGDTAAAWNTAGWGGWKTLAAMQYAVAPLTYPDGTSSTTKVSKTALRDPNVWATLTGQGDDMTQAEFDALMDAWWTRRMGAAAADNPQRAALQIAPWRQTVGRTGISTHNVLFDEMRTALLRIDLAAAAILTNVIADDADAETIKAHIDQRVTAAASDVVRGLALSGLSADDLASVLKAALGDRADEVGAAMLAGS